jgi:hypothetical protein
MISSGSPMPKIGKSCKMILTRTRFRTTLVGGFAVHRSL